MRAAIFPPAPESLCRHGRWPGPAIRRAISQGKPDHDPGGADCDRHGSTETPIPCRAQHRSFTILDFEHGKQSALIEGKLSVRIASYPKALPRTDFEHPNQAIQHGRKDAAPRPFQCSEQGRLYGFATIAGVAPAPGRRDDQRAGAGGKHAGVSHRKAFLPCPLSNRLLCHKDCADISDTLDPPHFSTVHRF